MQKNEEKLKFSEICKKANLKVTPQREIIYEILANTDQHPSVDMVYKVARERFSNISFDTVNRTLNTFVDIGVAFVVEGGGEVRRFDAGLSPHQHFKCIKCKKIIDFNSDMLDNIGPPVELDQGYEILNSVIYFEGICRNCNQKNINNELTEKKQ